MYVIMVNQFQQLNLYDSYINTTPRVQIMRQSISVYTKSFTSQAPVKKRSQKGGIYESCRNTMQKLPLTT